MIFESMPSYAKSTLSEANKPEKKTAMEAQVALLSVLTCKLALAKPPFDITILASEIHNDLFDGSQLVGAFYLNDPGRAYHGKSASYCVRFVSYYLESTKTRGAINRIVTLTKWIDPTRKIQELVMGFSARDPGNLGWFGYPREQGSFR